MPLADEAGGVAGGGEGVGDGALAEGDAIEAAHFEGIDGAGAVRVAAGEEGGAGGGADGRGGVVLGEADAFFGESVEAGSVGEAAVVAGDIAVSHVVGDDEDDVWARHGGTIAVGGMGVTGLLRRRGWWLTGAAVTKLARGRGVVWRGVDAGATRLD